MSRIIRDPFTYILPKIDIHGETTLTCTAVINAFIKDRVTMKQNKGVIIHGKGTGALRKATHEVLKKNKNVVKYYIDGMNDGQTIVEIKVKK